MTALKDRPYRDLAGDWHGGMCSALYAYASTGSIIEGLDTEILECTVLPWIEESDRDALHEFHAFVIREMED